MVIQRVALPFVFNRSLTLLMCCQDRSVGRCVAEMVLRPTYNRTVAMGSAHFTLGANTIVHAHVHGGGTLASASIATVDE